MNSITLDGLILLYILKLMHKLNAAIPNDTWITSSDGRQILYFTINVYLF